MSPLNKLRIERSEKRERLNVLSDIEGELTPDQQAESRKLAQELALLEPEYRAAIAAHEEAALHTEDGAGAEFNALEQRATVAGHVVAAMNGVSIRGAELEHTQALGAEGRFPLSLLAKPDPRGAEHKLSVTSADGQVNQTTWLDRLFGDSSHRYLGVSSHNMPGGGKASFPLTKTGPSSGQRNKGAATPDGTWTVQTTEVAPLRHSIRTVLDVTDDARLANQLEPSLQRDLAAALMEGVDQAIMQGSGTGASAITGLKTATGLATAEIAQNKKSDAATILAAFLGMRDGLHAQTSGELRCIAAVPTGNHFGSQIASSADNATLESFLRENGIMYRLRNGLEDGTADGDLAVLIGRTRMNTNAAVSVLWGNSGRLIRDEYGTHAAKGEIALTLNYLWNFAIVRPSSYGRISWAS